MNESAVIVPTLGAPTLGRCLAAIADLTPAPRRVVVVLSGRAADADLPVRVTTVRFQRRLGFAAAVNAGLAALPQPWPDVALLNDDAIPATGWLGALGAALASDPGVAAVQGTVVDASGERVDGRGIALDCFGLPVQVDRGRSAADEPGGPRPLLAVSGTAALFRAGALSAVRLPGGEVFDPAFGSYHEDLDLGLRLLRLGHRAAWIPDAPAVHLGSATGAGLRWRHPWWLLANRWRALAGNLSAAAFAAALPRLLRGEARAVRTLCRSNPRALAVAAAVLFALPCLVAGARARTSAGPRLAGLPRGTT